MTRSAARILAIAGLLIAAIVMLLWQSGGLAGIQQWAAMQQREAQTLMAGALRRLRAGEPGANLALMGICFGYGFLHAVGPGHGKVLIGGYGFGTKVALGRLALLSVAASLAQALTAVLLVWGGLTIFDLSREALTDLTEDSMADISAAMIGCVGLWLAWRGLRMLLRAGRSEGHRHDEHHHHDHVHDADCGCGHAHGPSIEEAAATRSLRDAVALIAGIAARPCTGAIFLLLLTWRMGFFPAGIAGAMAMGLGTASVTLAVAVLSVWAREGSFAMMPDTGPLAAMARWLPGILQLAAGAVVAIVAMTLLA
ncbi:nickel/cobalt transporter [Paracoccus saliphilus]|uniref:Nickel/cobalt efflux system n=1 Tax=Paracoccus saliphilus TaxID=405559 RepID=A0AA45W1U4_9RHOB|nr:hypothetical protein [Paracoccus saliphilus]WCR01695.1 hypothetical protein JHX88_12225 [Paracoccus saliphilus]SIS62129.1 ABC-type nickel/cobalt efflux system, permease component RcnA [Paracoccus saliphilus]